MKTIFHWVIPIMLIIIITSGCCITRQDYTVDQGQIDPLDNPAYDFDFEELSGPFYHTKLLAEELRLDRARNQCIAFTYVLKAPMAVLDDCLALVIPTARY